MMDKQMSRRTNGQTNKRQPWQQLDRNLCTVG